MKIVDKELGKKCQNTRISFAKTSDINGFWFMLLLIVTQICDATLGCNCLNLEDTICDMAKKYLLGGITGVNQEHYICVALLVSLIV